MYLALGVLFIGWLYCLAVWVRGRPHSVSDALHLIGNCIPKRLRDKYPRLGIRFGLWVALSLVSGSLLFILNLRAERNREDVVPVDTVLLRPAYGEADVSVNVTVEAQKEDESIQENLTVKIPSRDPDPDQVEDLISAAESYVKDYFADFTKHDGTWPSNYGEAAIICISRTPEWIDSNGHILWGSFSEPITGKIEVLISAYGVERELTVSCQLFPAEANVSDAIEELENDLEEGVYLTEDALILPEAAEDDTHYTWTYRQTNSGPDKVAVIFWLIVLPAVAVGVHEQRCKQKLATRRKQIYRSYPDLLNKLMILMGAGMSVVRSWEKIAEDYRRKKKRDHKEDPLYEEVLLAENRMNNGYSILQSIQIFSERVQIKEIRQFSAILQTSWKRGDDHILLHLKELHDRSWEIRKKQTRKLSEEADTKLLLPLMMMLIVVMIIVLTPALMTMTIR